MTTPNNAAALERLITEMNEWIKIDTDPPLCKVERWADELATLRATLAHEASGADWHWLRTDDWSEIVQAMPLGDDRYATGYQDAMNAVTRKLCSLPRPVINPAQPDALTSQLDVDALTQEIRRVDGGHSLAVDVLAEALAPYIVAPTSQPSGEAVAVAYVRWSPTHGYAWGTIHHRNAEVVNGDWRSVPLYTHPSAEAPGVAVDDEMVNRALKVWYGDDLEAHDMRAALTAALAPKPEGGHG